MKHLFILTLSCLLLSAAAFAQSDVPTEDSAPDFALELNDDASIPSEEPAVEQAESDPAPLTLPTEPPSEEEALPVGPGSQQAAIDIKEGEEQAKQREEEKRIADEKEIQEAQEKQKKRAQLNILELLNAGGILMWPIGFLSVIVIAFTLERYFALCRFAVMPGRLFKQIAPYLQPDKFSPTAIWNICERHRSPAGRVIQAMLLKIGRPLPEITAAAQSAMQEEATSLYSNVRWLNLAATLAPMLGLLGTVLGMIDAFYMTATLEVGANRAEQLSSGIYQALVTTAAGLAVAIPAAFIAHWYEGRIQNAFKAMDSKLLPIYDILERQEGKPRITLAQYMSHK